jgi:hypothetical protein
MRSIGLLVLMAGCGRVGFDELGAPATPIPTENLIAYYPFDDNVGAATLVDASGNGNDGACTACPEPAIGRIGGAARFDDTFVDVPSENFPDSGPVTIAIWALIEDRPSGGQVAIARPLAGDTDSWALVAFTDQTCWELSTPNGADAACIPGVIPEDRWTHLVGTHDGMRGELWIDGIRVVQHIFPIEYDGSPIRIGGDINDDNLAFQWVGLIDEVRIYDRVLAANEIAVLASGVE